MEGRVKGSNASGAENLCTALLQTLAYFEKVQRKFHPMMMERHAEALAHKAALLEDTLKGFLSQDPGQESSAVEGSLVQASNLVLEAVSLFRAEGGIEAGLFNVMRAGRKVCRAYESLYAIRFEVREVDAFFGNGSHSPAGEGDRLVRLGQGGDPYARGDSWLYAPGEESSPSRNPLVVALHGGYSHGRDFIWTWMREARSRGFHLLAPSSQGRTWAITRPEADLGPLMDLVQKLCSEYPIDTSRVLLTGFSDGATFALGCAMLPTSPFSAYCAISGVLPPGNPAHARGRRILWIHGAYDWMFPAGRAVAGYRALSGAGADVSFKIVGDLAHAFPFEEKGAILSWFDPSLVP